MKTKKDVWTNGTNSTDVYRSTYNPGSRYLMLKPVSCYMLRGFGWGVNGFASRDDAHKFLATRGYYKAKS